MSEPLTFVDPARFDELLDFLEQVEQLSEAYMLSLDPDQPASLRRQCLHKYLITSGLNIVSPITKDKNARRERYRRRRQRVKARKNQLKAQNPAQEQANVEQDCDKVQPTPTTTPPSPPAAESPSFEEPSGETSTDEMTQSFNTLYVSDDPHNTKVNPFLLPPPTTREKNDLRFAALLDDHEIGFSLYARYFFSDYLLRSLPVLSSDTLEMYAAEAKAYVEHLLALNPWPEFQTDLQAAVRVLEQVQCEVVPIVYLNRHLPGGRHLAKGLCLGGEAFYRFRVQQEPLESSSFETCGIPATDIEAVLQQYDKGNLVQETVDGNLTVVEVDLKRNLIIGDLGEFRAVREPATADTPTYPLWPINHGGSCTAGHRIQLEFEPHICQRFSPGMVMGAYFHRLPDGAWFMDRKGIIWPSYYLETFSHGDWE
ncbi:hypothetical protein IWQ62_004164 [Dispira parvispora]|uniref:Uncharacterized protein n=1 Tax=Dispira parvispora TaxID=1520584 RepID=A0A9W8ASY8_9FUNG|nr:hypothetical protein IWQ62_004164 [Dispira parvispora]